MNSNRVKSCLGRHSRRHAHACMGMMALGLMLLLGCEQPSPPQKPAVNAPPAPVPVVIVQKKAEVGVGEKGRDYGQGIVATPAATLFAAKERLVFEVQIPQAMQLFKATENRVPVNFGPVIRHNTKVRIAWRFTSNANRHH